MPDNKKLDYIQERIDAACESLAKIDKDVAIQRTSLEAHTKQDEQMYEELRRMNDILQSNTESLREHMHRSDLLEDLVTKMDRRLSPIEVEYIQKAAVKDYVLKNAKLIGKVATAIAAIAGLWVYVKPLLEHMLK